MAYVLKCNAEFNKIYYVKYQNSLRECKFIRTEGYNYKCYYVLNIAGVGIINIEHNPNHNSYPDWWRTSLTPGILYESIDAYRKQTPITDNYGTTENAYNHRFIQPLFPNYSVCNCGGGIYTWKWDGCQANRYKITGHVSWKWDEDGFTSNLCFREDCFPSKSSCEEANQIEVVKF